VDQDDYVTFNGAQGFLPPANIQADNYSIQGVRMPFLKFPRIQNSNATIKQARSTFLEQCHHLVLALIQLRSASPHNRNNRSATWAVIPQFTCNSKPRLLFTFQLSTPRSKRRTAISACSSLVSGMTTRNSSPPNGKQIRAAEIVFQHLSQVLLTLRRQSDDRSWSSRLETRRCRASRM